MATRTARPSNTRTPSATKALAPVQVAPMTSAKAPATGARKPAVKKPASPIKATAKPAVKTAVKPLLKTAAVKAAVTSVRKPVTPPKTHKSGKDKKPKLVRDSFTVPKAEYMVLDELKLRADTLMTSAKKSALIRAGIKALAAMSDPAFLAALKAVPALKTGRPKK